MNKKIIIFLAIIFLILVLIFLIIQPKKDSKNKLKNISNNSEAISETKTDPLINNNIKNKMHTITINTTLGSIVFETYDADAPNTVSNFIKLANKGFYDNIIFHRVIKGFMIQGGDPTGTGTGGPGYSFADELNSNTESYKEGYKRGIVAMANAGPNTNGSQFFIMLRDTPLPNNYTIFGKVVAGQDVVDVIGSLETGANDRPINPPYIKNIIIKENK